MIAELSSEARNKTRRATSSGRIILFNAAKAPHHHSCRALGEWLCKIDGESLIPLSKKWTFLLHSCFTLWPYIKIKQQVSRFQVVSTK